VVAVDQMVASGMVDLAPVRELARRLTGRGCRRAREACALADGLAESPQETRVRLLIGRSPLPAPRVHRVHVGARFVAEVDFGWPEQRLALEYDGLWHAAPRRFTDDRRRLNRLLAAGWRVLLVTTADLYAPRSCWPGSPPPSPPDAECAVVVVRGREQRRPAHTRRARTPWRR
jgi:hypothetical protein